MPKVMWTTFRTSTSRPGIPRWDTAKAGWMEMWIQRTIDSYSLLRPSVLLNVIEGVYAQNGDGFTTGPGAGGVPEIFMTNVLIFGKDAFRVDIIGHWLGGHEPGNFGLFHIGRERGVSTALNPRNIPIYRWEDAGPQLIRARPVRAHAAGVSLPSARWRKRALFHLCNEPYTYPTEPPGRLPEGGESPGLRVLGRIGRETGDRVRAGIQPAATHARTAGNFR